MLKELERYRMEREEMERLRDELVKRAKMLEAKQYNRKNQGNVQEELRNYSANFRRMWHFTSLSE